MAATQANPRRRALKSATPPVQSSFHPSAAFASTHPVQCRRAPEDDPDMPLRRAATFHSPRSPSSEDSDPIFDVPSLPTRSRTCRRDLEDAIAAGEKRMAGLIGSIDRSLSGLHAAPTDGQETLRAEDLPVPRVVLDAHLSDVDMVDRDSRSQPRRSGRPGPPQPVRKHHSSDSGIGSTVSGSICSGATSDVDVKEELTSRTRPIVGAVSHRRSAHLTLNTNCTRSAITRSISSTASAAVAGSNVLGDYATKQIQKHIITPLLRQKLLKDFHPLVHGIPRRICQREITCLRDLEKTLIFLAPKWSVSKAAYLHFCETSIQCIHTTVDYLNDSDQRRPSDRPYSNGYFLDLVEQVRQYAAMIAAARARQAAGEGAKATDYSPDEKLELQGGLSQTGRPAQLVRVKDGKTMAIGNQTTADDEAGWTPVHHGMKRSRSVESSDDDSVTRSMARRRKSVQAPPKPAVLKCSDCDKEFKRPCDLTKHEKTHSRPWKCSEPTCKYSHHGWPTEKERDRHVNDKHSAAPPLYRCHFHPCTYSSKRESNCKQHMEKAHNWTYVRSKNNGRKGRPASSVRTPSVQQVTTPQSSVVELSTPLSRAAPSPYDNYGVDSRRHSCSVDGSSSASEHLTPYSNGSVVAGASNTFGAPYHQPNFDFNGYTGSLHTPEQMGYSPANTTDFRRPSFDTASLTNAPTTAPTSFDTSLTLPEHDPTVGQFGWSRMDHDFTSYNAQMITPASSVFDRRLPSFGHPSAVSLPGPGPAQPTGPSLSPGAQGNVMLYTPDSQEVVADEGFYEFVGETGKPTADFPLFDGSHGTSSLSSVGKDGLFPELPIFDRQFARLGWPGFGADMSQQFGLGDDLQMDDEHDE